METHIDIHGRLLPVPKGALELVRELEWAVEADSSPDRDERTRTRRAAARDALLRFIAGPDHGRTVSLVTTV